MRDQRFENWQIKHWLSLCLVTWVFPGCAPSPSDMARVADRSNQAWVEHYQDGWAAIKQKDYESAERHLLLALKHAESFDSTDRRLPETLDDLGLVYYSLNNDFQAERMQGRAICELLLTKGAQDPDVKIFITRLGYIYNRQGRQEHTTPLVDHPYTIFKMGYCIEDVRFTKRLDALIYDYQSTYHKEAVEYLTNLNRTIRDRLLHRGDAPPPEESSDDTDDTNEVEDEHASVDEGEKSGFPDDFDDDLDD